MSTFKNKETEDVYRGNRSKKARKKCPNDIWQTARRKLNNLLATDNLQDIKRIPGNQYKKLKGDRAGRSSIRINDQYRITFVWTDEGAEEIDIIDYHN